jgi:hypothetical protein
MYLSKWCCEEAYEIALIKEEVVQPGRFTAPDGRKGRKPGANACRRGSAIAPAKAADAIEQPFAFPSAVIAVALRTLDRIRSASTTSASVRFSSTAPSSFAANDR